MERNEPYGLMTDTEYKEYEAQMNRLAKDSARLRLTLHSTLAVTNPNDTKD